MKGPLAPQGTRAIHTFPLPLVTLRHEWATMPLLQPIRQGSLLHGCGLSKGHHGPPRCPQLTRSSDSDVSISLGTEAPRPPPWGQTPLPCKGGECGAERPQRQTKTRLFPLPRGGAAPPAGSRLSATHKQGSPGAAGRGGWPPAHPSRTPAPCLDGLSGRLVASRALGRWPDPTPPPVPAAKLSSMCLCHYLHLAL